MPTYLTETFESGPPFHDQIADIYGEYDTPGWGTTYPITLGYEANVIAGIGKASSYGLGAIPGYEDSGYWWSIFQVFPSTPRGGPGVSQTPLEDAGKGRVQFDLKLYDGQFGATGGATVGIFDLSRGYFDANMGLGLILSNETAITGGGWKWYFIGSLGEAPNSQPHYYHNVYSPMFSCAAADLLDGEFHTIEFTWQAGTVTQWTAYNDITIEADGWLKLTVDGATVFHQQNIALIFNEGGSYSDPDGTYHNYSSTAVNRFTAVMLGDQGWYPGVFDNLIIGTPIEAPPPATWVDIANFVELEMAKSTFPGGHCRVLIDLWTDTPGATIQARLQNVTDNTTVGTSPVIVATTPTYAGFFAQLEGNDTTTPGTSTPGAKAYQFWRFADDGTDNLTDGETCTLGTKTYTFKDTLTNVAGYVKIGATLVETLTNMGHAVACVPGYAGVTYAAAAVVNELAEAFVSRVKGTTAPDGGIYPDTHLLGRALVAGEAGNSIACLSTRSAPYGWVGEGNVPHDHLYSGINPGTTPPVTVIDLKYYRLQVTTDTPEAALFAHGPGLVY